MATPKKKEETAVTLVPRSEMQMAAAQSSSHQEVVASDVIIPRLLLMQAISPLVTGRKAQIGDMVRSTTNEKLGDPEHSVPLIALSMTNSWIDFENVPGEKQPRFRGTYPRGVTKRDANGNPIESNQNLDWKFTGPEGQVMFRRQAIVLYALLPNDIAAYEKEVLRAIESGEVPDLGKGVSPVVLTFQSTSFKYGGKQIATFFNNIKKTNHDMRGKMTVAPFDYVLNLSCREEKSGTVAWYVMSFDAPKALTKVFTDPSAAQAIKEKAAFWTQALSSGGVKVDESGEVSDEGSSSGVAEMEV